jgi:hypothetical protein
MGNKRFAYEDTPVASLPVAEGERILVLLESLYVGAFDEPGKGEVLLSFSFSTFGRSAAALEPATVLKEIGLPRLKNRMEVDWLRGTILFGPAPVHRSLAVTASALEIDRGTAVRSRVNQIAGFATSLGSPADIAFTGRRFEVLSSFLEMVNSLNADDLILQESETFLVGGLPDVPRLRQGRILVQSGHPDPADRTRLVLSVRMAPDAAVRRRAASALAERLARRSGSGARHGARETRRIRSA